MNNIEMKPTKKDHYRLLLNGVDVTGEQERSVFRHIIQKMDSAIDNLLLIDDNKDDDSTNNR